MHGSWVLVLASGAAVAGGPPATQELTVIPARPVAATIDDRPARLLIGSGGPDRLTLDADYVTANGIRPALLVGGAELSVAGRHEFKGHNRPLTLTVAGLRRKARAFWFDSAPDSGVDGRVGPWGLPQERVTFALAPASPAETVLRLVLQGGPDVGSYAGVRLNGTPVYLSFAVEDGGRLPVVTAALGALIAQEYGGALEGPSWNVEVVMGVKRPDEVVVTARAGGPAPSYGMTIPGPALTGCSRLTFDKRAKKVELACRTKAAG